jgi:hypothetical protein
MLLKGAQKSLVNIGGKNIAFQFSSRRPVLQSFFHFAVSTMTRSRISTAIFTVKLAVQRIKSLCGAKPPQKLGWTNAGRWAAIGAMGISPGTLGAWADNRGSACLVWIV